MDGWRPDRDRLSYNDAAWAGAAWGLALHATLHLFSAAMPSLERALVVFAIPERVAFGIASNAAPIGRWFVLLLAVAFYGVLAGVFLLAVFHECLALARAWRTRHASAPARADSSAHRT
jgi:hypothetical protein